MSEDLTPPLSSVSGRSMYKRRWDAWHEGVFDAMEVAQLAYDRGERLPSDDEHTMFWAWAHESFQRQGRHAAEEVTDELERGMAALQADYGEPVWDGETWRELGQRSYARGYSWALHVELRRLCFGSGGVMPEDREAYNQARGQDDPDHERP